MKHLFLLFGLLSSIVSQSQDLNAYAIYDFVPGEKTIFEDIFKDDKEGLAPSNWKLTGGKAVVKMDNNEKIVSILEYYTGLAPKIKNSALPKSYTIELDYYLDAGYEGNPGVMVSFRNAAGDEVANVTPNKLNTSFGRSSRENVVGDNPADILNENFYNKWHHIAIAYSNNQMAIYINQHKVLDIPQCDFIATSFQILGNASGNMPMYFKNFRFAENTNVVSQAMAQGKLVTHAIRFDVNKAEVRSESLGLIHQIADYLKANPAVKFEVGGHTDSDGEDAANLKLSELRAQAVKKILIDFGAADGQLTIQGYGETKPISPNTTPDGKANNRRVEFIKK
ncbi:MAG: OmpA family protein [Bacteroidetes bacterium]|nr:OmpA family protein [Bacteroidota bacterium]